MSFEKKLKKLSQRNWSQIRGLWVPYLQEVAVEDEPHVSTPEELSDLTEMLNRVGKDGEQRDQIAGLHESVFGRAVFCLRRAVHVFCSAECHLDSGFVSWSSASSYHSALFSGRAIMGFLGVTTVQKSSSYYSIDLFPSATKMKYERSFKRGSEMQFMYLGSLAQRQWWMIFQKLLDKSDVKIWDQNYVDRLLQLDEKNFAIQRNRLIYRDELWELEGLFAPICCPWDAAGWRVVSADSIDIGRTDFTVCLALILLRMATSLLKDLEEESPVVSSVLREVSDMLQSFRAVRAEEFISAGLLEEEAH